MKKIILICCIIVLVFLIQTCKEESPVSELVNEYPKVEIISPENEESYIKNVLLIANATDDKGVVKLEFYINNKTDSSKTYYAPPFIYNWQPIYNTDSTEYSIFAKAYDADNNVTISKPVTVYVRKFGPPSNLRINSISETKIVLNWDDNSAVKTGFEIERKTANSQFKLITRLDSNITSYIDDSLDFRSQYFYRVRAYKKNVKTEYSENLLVKFKYQFSYNFLITGHNQDGTWGSLYSPVMISKNSSLYAYSFENTNKIFVNSFDHPSNSTSFYFDNGSAILDIKCSFLNNNLFLAATDTGKIYSFTAFHPSVPIKTFSTNSDTVYSISFSKNNNIIASSEATGEITIWDFEFAIKKQSLNTNIYGRTIVLILPDNNTLITGDKFGRIKYWDINSGVLLNEFDAHYSSITQLIYNEAKNIIISSSMDGYLKFWNLNDGSLENALFANDGGVTDVSISKNGEFFVTGGMDQKINYFIYPELIKLWEFSNMNFNNFLRVSLAPNRSNLLVGGNRNIGVFENYSKWISN